MQTDLRGSHDVLLAECSTVVENRFPAECRICVLRMERNCCAGGGRRPCDREEHRFRAMRTDAQNSVSTTVLFSAVSRLA